MISIQPICFECGCNIGVIRCGSVFYCEDCGERELGLPRYVGGDAYDRARDECEQIREGLSDGA